MNKTHSLKINYDYYLAIKQGFKQFEIRKNDRDFKKGDFIKFVVLLKEGNALSEDTETYEITYMLKDVPQYGLKDGYCILGIKKISNEISELDLKALEIIKEHVRYFKDKKYDDGSWTKERISIYFYKGVMNAEKFNTIYEWLKQVEKERGWKL